MIHDIVTKIMASYLEGIKIKFTKEESEYLLQDILAARRRK